LETILQTELAPYTDTADRVTIEGPRVMLTPKAGLSLAMAVHELATNAAKYGALSAPRGRLSVNWQSVPDAEHPNLRIVWQEEVGQGFLPPPSAASGRP
jgi:two-component system, chemotaxis family, CheB/CheR fusion protein